MDVDSLLLINYFSHPTNGILFLYLVFILSIVIAEIISFALKWKYTSTVFKYSLILIAVYVFVYCLVVSYCNNFYLGK